MLWGRTASGLITVSLTYLFNPGPPCGQALMTTTGKPASGTANWTDVACPCGMAKGLPQCYQIFAVRLNFTAAQNACATLPGGHLVFVETDEKRNMLQHYLTINTYISPDYWLGLDSHSKWAWPGGSPIPVNVTHWEDGEPKWNDSSKHVAFVLYDTRLWRSTHVNDKHFVLCQSVLNVTGPVAPCLPPGVSVSTAPLSDTPTPPTTPTPPPTPTRPRSTPEPIREETEMSGVYYTRLTEWPKGLYQRSLPANCRSLMECANLCSRSRCDIFSFDTPSHACIRHEQAFVSVPEDALAIPDCLNQICYTMKTFT